MKGNYTMRRIWGVVDTIFDWVLVLALLISLYNVAQRNIFKEDMPMTFGRGYAVVISGSMEPAIGVTDVVYVRRQESYKVGDIITFVDEASPSKSLVTHRIIEVTDSGYVTKGDANNTKDEGVVAPSSVKGAVYWVLPYFGATLLWMQKPVGTLCMILLALLFIELPYRLRTRYKKATKERVDEIRSKIGPQSEKKKFTPDLYWEENDGSYKKFAKTKKQKDFEKEIEYRRRKKQRRKIYVPDEKHWNLDD